MKKYTKTGVAPTIKKAGFVQFPYGEVQPVLNCRPNYGCDVELQAGETIQAVILGDESLWDYMVWDSNQESKPISHITIGPRAANARTNAIIGTNRRTYHLELLSTSSAAYTRSAKFYYPKERLKSFQKKKAVQEKPKASLPHELLSFNWKAKAKESTDWQTSRVFDDGKHTYIEIPAKASPECLSPPLMA